MKYRFFKKSDYQNNEVIQGPGVKAISDAVDKLVNQTDPNTGASVLGSYDSKFFNDWANYINPTGMEHVLLTDLVYRLARYRNHLPEYDYIYDLLATDYENHTEHGMRYQDQKLLHAVTYGGMNENRYVLTIPGIQSHPNLYNTISSHLDRLMRSNGIDAESKDEHLTYSTEMPDSIEVSDMFLNDVSEILEKLGYNTERIPRSSNSNKESNERDKLKFAGKQYSHGSWVYTIKVPSDNASLQDEMMNLSSSRKGIQHVKGSRKKSDKYVDTYTIKEKDSNPHFEEIYTTLKRHVDTSELDSFLSYEENNKQSDNSKKHIIIADSEHPHMQLSLKTMDNDDFKHFEELIKFSFPLKTESKSMELDKDSSIKGAKVMATANRYFSKDGRNGVFSLSGDYATWQSFLSLVGSEYDTGELVRRLGAIADDGGIKRGRNLGALDGYYGKKEGVEYPAVSDAEEGKVVAYTNFKNDLNFEVAKSQSSKPETKRIKLHGPQVDGAAFLYGRNSAVLGDEPGVGKTFQLISAMHLRMKASGGNALIMTIGPVKTQFQNAIIDLLGEDERDNISISESSSPIDVKRWTICSYTDFSNGKKEKIEARVQSIRNGGFTVASLDELHNLAGHNTKRTSYVSQVTNSIPFVWGATATIASNSPKDVYNQLRVLNHTLGKMKRKDFNTEFVAEGKDLEERTTAATALRKWLAKSQVYERRTKKEVRPDMPDLIVNEMPCSVGLKALDEGISQRVKDYANSDNPLSLLIAARTEIANAKSSLSVEQSMNLILQGEKVLVFSTFKGAAKQIFDELQKELDFHNQTHATNYYAVSYIGEDDHDTRKKNENTFKTQDNCIAIVMSMKIGGTGVDFPNISSHIIMNDFDWTPASATQAEGRTHRINSNNNTNIHYIIAENTIDRKLFDKVQIKRKLARLVEDRESRIGKKDSETDKKLTKDLIELKAYNERLDAELRKERDDYMKGVIDNIDDNTVDKKELEKELKRQSLKDLQETKKASKNNKWERIS